MNLLRKAILATMLAMTLPFTSPALAQTATTSPVSPQFGLGVNDTLVSQDSRFLLRFQGDGNLVLYQGGRALWASGPKIGVPTYGYSPLNAVFQSDGNLVVYWNYGSTVNPVAVWASNTNGNYGATLEVQNDGNMVIYNSSHVAIWSTNTCCH